MESLIKGKKCIQRFGIGTVADIGYYDITCSFKTGKVTRTLKKEVPYMPKDAEYQGVNEKGNPLYYSKSLDLTFESLGGYGTPLYGKPRAGNRFRIIGEKKLKEVV